MKSLITGAGGFVGHHLFDHLAAEGDEVVALDMNNGPDLRDGDGWRSIVADVSPEAIYHLAGWSDVGASWSSPVEVLEVNAVGTANVIQAARRAGVPTTLVVSSADVYGRAEITDLPLTETSPIRPRSPYGASKAAAEQVALQAWRGFDQGVVIVRPFNHIGPGQGPRFVAASFAAQVAEAIERGHGRIRHGDLSARRDFTDVRDVVRAYRMLMLGAADPERRERIVGGIFNVCSGDSIAMEELLAALIAKAGGAEIGTELDPDLLRPVELPELKGSPDKLEAVTGWRPVYTLSTTLDDLLADARTSAGWSR